MSDVMATFKDAAEDHSDVEVSWNGCRVSAFFHLSTYPGILFLLHLQVIIVALDERTQNRLSQSLLPGRGRHHREQHRGSMYTYDLIHDSCTVTLTHRSLSSIFYSASHIKFNVTIHVIQSLSSHGPFWGDMLHYLVERQSFEPFMDTG